MRWLLFGSVIVAQFAWANPVVERWPADVLFYQSFDTGVMTPDIGYATFSAQAKNVRFEAGGVAGSCYAGTGSFNYMRKDPSVPIIDTTKPGTVIVWVKYLGARKPIVRNTGEWEEGFPILQATGTNGNTLYLMKSADCRWKGGTIKLHLQATVADGDGTPSLPAEAERKTANAGRKTANAGRKTYCAGSVGAHSSFVDWKPGEWRMVAAGWTADKLRVSVNGEPFRETPLKVPVGDLAGHLFVRGDERTRLDELVILGRGLTDAEVRSVYDGTCLPAVPFKNGPR